MLRPVWSQPPVQTGGDVKVVEGTAEVEVVWDVVASKTVGVNELVAVGAFVTAAALDPESPAVAAPELPSPLSVVSLPVVGDGGAIVVNVSGPPEPDPEPDPPKAVEVDIGGVKVGNGMVVLGVSVGGIHPSSPRFGFQYPGTSCHQGASVLK
eukprot:m.73806 g.73806  ORF g.73806 m.73806 type:complete len:153 (-) comp12376_c1_seq1:1733-2191(-)